MTGPGARPVIADWRAGVERSFVRVRRASFGIGMVGAPLVALAADWQGGWVLSAIFALVFGHSVWAARLGAPLAREIAMDAGIIGLAVWALDTRHLGFLLIYPLAIAILLGHLRLVWTIAGIGVATSALAVLDEVFTSSPTAARIANLWGTPPWSPGEAVALTYLALSGVGIALLVALWQVASNARTVEHDQSQLIRAAAHDLRNAVAVVNGLAEVLVEEHATDEEGDGLHEELLGAISASASEAVAISADLLSLAGHEPDGTAIAVDFDLAGLVTSIAGAHPEVHVEAPPGLTVRSYPQRVGQIVRNLISNAVRHGGPLITTTVAEEGGRVAIRVADNGEGLATDPNQYFATRASTHPEGMGIGLANSVALARAIGARLAYKRHDGHTVFTLSFDDPTSGLPGPDVIAPTPGPD